MKIVQQLIGVLLVTGGFVFMLGCGDSGPKLEPVSGKVLKDGKPMTNVSITMVPVSTGLAAMGTADSSGNIRILTNGRAGP